MLLAAPPPPPPLYLIAPSPLARAAYNAVNGVPSCANDWLLGTLLRDSWQFDGYVTSDCAFSRVPGLHPVAPPNRTL